MPRLLAEIAYQRAVHALGQQEAALNELRSRTGTVLAAEALTTSFLGAAAVQRETLDLPGRLAITSFAVSLCIALCVLLPWRGLRFSLSGPRLYEELQAFGDDEEEIYRRAAYWLQVLWFRNEAVMARLFPLFTASVAALGAELVFWGLALKDLI